MNTNIDWQQIKGTTRKRTHFLAPYEDRWIDFLAPKVPGFIETYHLTWSSLVSSVIILVSGILGRNNIIWIWGISLGIVLHYVTDALDGEIGRRRNTGLVKWGMYVDHFLDFVFTSSLLLSYALIFPEISLIFYILMFIMTAFFIHEHLKCIALGEFHTQGYFGISGTELAVLLVLFNFIIVSFNLFFLVKYVFALGMIGLGISLIYHFYQTQKKIWQVDMRNKIGEK